METQTEYLPELLRTITQSLCVSCVNLKDSEMKKSLQLCSKILSKVLPSMAPVGSYEGDGSPFKPKPKPKEKEEIEEEEEDEGVLVEEAREAIHEDLNEAEESELNYDSLNHFKLSPTRKPALSRESSACGPATLMQACMQSFQSLFHTYVSSCVIRDEHLVDILLQQLMSSTPSNLVPPSSPLPRQGSSSSEASEVIRRVNLTDLPSTVADAFLCACQLLVEFSSLPMYCTDYQRVLQTSFKAGVLSS